VSSDDIVTGETLMNDPRWPYVQHTPIERLRLDPANLPGQRLRPNGTPVCLACDNTPKGRAILCSDCRRKSENLAKQRARLEASPDVVLSKRAVNEVLELVHGLTPLMGQLTRVYNTDGADLRDETDALMRAVKRVQSKVIDLLPDTRDPATRRRR